MSSASVEIILASSHEIDVNGCGVVTSCESRVFASVIHEVQHALQEISLFGSRLYGIILSLSRDRMVAKELVKGFKRVIVIERPL